MKKPIAMLFGFGMLSLTACSNGFEAAQLDVSNAIKANQAAATYDAWHASEDSPEHVFEKWREEISKEGMTAADVCQALKEMDVKHLTLFEQELDEEVNQDIVKDCASELTSRLNDYYRDDRATLTTNLGNFFDEETVFTAPGKQTVVLPGAGVNKTSQFKFQTIERAIDTRNGFDATARSNGKRLHVGPKEVVLTFDDGPSPYTKTILKTLAEVDAKVMFFHVGRNVIANKEYVKMVANDGHVVGGHSMTHANLGKLGLQSAEKEMYGSLNAIQSVLGWAHPVFRFPYGSSRSDLKNSLKTHHVGEFFWNVDSLDWKSGRSNSEMIEFTMKQVRANNGGIVLFHDIQKRTMESLPQFLAALHKEGYKIAVLRPTNVMMSPIKLP
ncbi:polysaccharide deacetylase family protein [Bdellovibrio sp. HCB288]|uniref:polysaccharide deacetylase family protein n=1 Tax=Bdellovibrio sp. HCB288 TaxID=3394355 RepID=UPI0039B3EC7A